VNVLTLFSNTGKKVTEVIRNPPETSYLFHRLSALFNKMNFVRVNLNCQNLTAKGRVVIKSLSAFI